MHAFNVKDTFFIETRGVIVMTDMPLVLWPRGLVVKIGDAIEFRRDGQTVLSTFISGMEICCPSSPEQTFAFLLPSTISKKDVPLDSEIWIMPKNSRTESIE